MPAKFFSATVMALFKSAPPLEAVVRALAALGEVDLVAPTGGWLGGFPGLVFRFNRSDESRIVIDVVDRPWPDTMGHPQTDPDLFSCWCLGGFGPLVYPGCLERAVQHAHDAAGPAGQTVVPQHRAFVRVRKTSSPGAQPLTDLVELVVIVRALLDIPAALAYFQPNGEVLLDVAELDANLDHSARTRIPAIELHVNLRLWCVEDVDNRSLFDTVGMGQFLVPDLEVLFDTRLHSEETVARFVRNVSLHQLQQGDVLLDGDTVGGPGGSWRVERRDESRVAPPRSVIRLAAEVRS